MNKLIYEVLDEFEEAPTKKEKLDVLRQNWSPVLLQVFQLAYHPDIKWKINDWPAKYKIPETAPGIAFSSVRAELRRMYMFMEGNPTAEKLSPQKREELLLVMLESLEYREAEVIVGILKKDLGVKGLTYKFIRDNIQGVVP